MFTFTEGSYALLQLGLAAATATLFAVCLTTHTASRTVVGLIYSLSFWCFVTLTLTKYIPKWVTGSMGILMLLLALTAGVVGIINYNSPVTDKMRTNQRLMFAVGGIIILFLGIWYFDI